MKHLRAARQRGERTYTMESSLRRVVPVLGHYKVIDLTHEMFAAFAYHLFFREHLKRRTVNRIIYAAATVIGDAVPGLILVNPASIPKNLLPPAEEDEEEAARLVLQFSEIRSLLFDVRIPFGRRLFWALIILAGLRFGEAAAFRWRSYVPRQPLNEMIIREQWDTHVRKIVPHTKTKVVRHVPACETLADFIEEARVGWWPETFGRAPQPRDFVAPHRSRRGNAVPRRGDVTLGEWKGDLELFDYEERTQHKARHTFVTRLEELGGSPGVIKAMTHPPKPKNAFDVYRHIDWAPRCGVVRLWDEALRESATPR